MYSRSEFDAERILAFELSTASSWLGITSSFFFVFLRISCTQYIHLALAFFSSPFSSAVHDFCLAVSDHGPCTRYIYVDRKKDAVRAQGRAGRPWVERAVSRGRHHTQKYILQVHTWGSPSASQESSAPPPPAREGCRLASEGQRGLARGALPAMTPVQRRTPAVAHE